MELTPDLLATEYRNARNDVRALLSDLDPADEDRIVPATPEWTVRNLVAHLAGFAIEPAAGNLPTEPIDAWMQSIVAKHAATPVSTMLEGWDEHGPMLEGFMEPMYDTVAPLVYDTVCHEHDLRSALGRPGNRDTSAMRAGLEQCAVAASARVADGEVDGAVVLSIDGASWTCGEGDVAATLDLSGRPDGAYELFRLLCTRRTGDQMRALPWTGDPEPFLPLLAHHDWPIAPLPHDHAD